KLMAEKTLESYYDELGMKSTSLRYFTVYGERGKMNHAITAMIGRAFLEQNPYKVWGDGSAIRNWTRVEDIVDGTVKAAEKIDDATPINLGIERRISVEEAAKTILEITGHDAKIKYLPDKPVGVLNRVADNTRARKLLNWKPSKTFEEGLEDMVDWFYSYHDKDDLSERWGRDLLMER
ncbi:MAG TPA: NAD-dependent epimerase/dehydratase family protein, partial [Halanaerobiales bacterium]|nr:NAD-dependent epimerase/dehydratase family protein [Halanaerobiales bacterium]